MFYLGLRLGNGLIIPQFARRLVGQEREVNLDLCLLTYISPEFVHSYAQPFHEIRGKRVWGNRNAQAALVIWCFRN